MTPKIVCFSTVMLFVESLYADIDVRAFTNIEDKIDEKYQYLNPLWGKIALDNGIIYDLRFFAPLNTVKIEAPLGLIKRLFPSVTGALGTTTNADTNFARYVDNPKTIAILFKIADDARNGKNIDNALKDKLADTLKYGKKKKKDMLRKVVNPLVEELVASVKAEKSQAFLPGYFTENILAAFFVKKFNNQTDIWTLLENLNQTFGIEIAKNIPKSETVLTENSLLTIAKAVSINTEQVYNLLTSDIFDSVTPYRDSVPFVENETICAYIRKTDFVDTAFSFSDCAETAIRHVLNLLLYNNLKRDFDLSHFENDNSSSSNVSGKTRSIYFSHLLDFYRAQRASLANDSSDAIRTAWNKVVADMNQETDAIKVRYVKPYNNEVDAGFINFIHTLQKIFSISLTPMPQNVDDQQQWIIQSLQTIFSFINPQFSYEFTPELPDKNADDIYGRILVTVRRDEQLLFSFSIAQSPIHAKVTDLKTLLPRTFSQQNFLSEKDRLLASGVLDKLKPYQQGLLLLAGRLAQSEPYVTFAEILDTNLTRIKWLERLSLSSHPLFSEGFLQEVLNAMSWNDRQTVSRIPLEALMKNIGYKNVLLAHVQGLIIDNFKPVNYPSGAIALKDYKNLKYIYGKESSSYVDSSSHPEFPSSIVDIDLGRTWVYNLSLENLPNLKNLNLKQSRIGILQLKNTPSLEVLNLENTPTLKELSLIDAGNITDLEFYENYEKLTLHRLNKLQKIELIKINLIEASFIDLPNVSKFIINTGLESLTMRNLPALENDLKFPHRIAKLYLSELPHIKSIEFGRWLGYRKRDSIVNIGDLAQVATIDMGSYEDGRQITLENCPLLKNLVLKNSSIKSAVFKSLPKLETIDLSHTSNLSLDFTPFKELYEENKGQVTIDLSKAELQHVYYIDSQNNKVPVSLPWFKSIGGRWTDTPTLR